ncbi:MAG: rhomboid family intramembrane serine protease, partial [Deltaproteobacteria bacterium]
LFGKLDTQMIFPIGDDQVRGGHFPRFSYGFIWFNGLVFIIQTSLSEPDLEWFFYHFGAVPAWLFEGEGWHGLLTSQFVHAGWGHLLGNMLFMWVFADNIEATVGSRRFVLFYLTGGVLAVLAHAWFHPDSTVPMVGASGAISAVMGAYLVLFPGSRIKLLFLVFPFRVHALVFLVFWFYQQAAAGMQELDGITVSQVAWWAHISGFVFGALAGWWFRLSGLREGVELEG